jgi:hypothetical protein
MYVCQDVLVIGSIDNCLILLICINLIKPKIRCQGNMKHIILCYKDICMYEFNLMGNALIFNERRLYTILEGHKAIVADH